MPVVMAIDLDSYCRRIGYSGSRAPSLETLRAIHLLHPREIAFENLNPLMNWPVQLDAASLEQKLVRDGRGGYCFEHNLLLGHVLEALGFQVKGLAAQVVLGGSPDGATPRPHNLLLVEMEDGAYIADVGFGGVTLTAPLRLEPDVEQPTPHETHRLVNAGEEFALQASIGGEWTALYRFDLQEQLLPDYEVSNRFTSTHPNSRFVTDLMVARADTECRYTLRNDAHSVYHANGEIERRTLSSAGELQTLLENTFRISLPDTPDLDAALDRIVHQSK